MLQSAIDLISTGDNSARGTDEALLLSVALAITINTFTGYEDWDFGKKVLLACGRRIIKPQPNDPELFRELTRPIGGAHGMHFLCDLRMDGSVGHRALRLPRAAALTFGSNVRRLFGIAEEAQLAGMQPPVDPPVDPIEWAPVRLL
jgi:hypothetical protein